MSKTLYKIVTANADEWKVVRKSDGKAVFYGTASECREWVERNGHDDWR